MSHVNKNKLVLPLFKSQRHQKQWLSYYDLKKVSNISFIKIHSIKYPETIYFLDQQLLGSKSFPQTKDFSSKCDGIYSFLRLWSHFRSSRPELFFKKSVHRYTASSIFYCFFTANALKSFAKFNRKHRLTVFILGKVNYNLLRCRYRAQGGEDLACPWKSKKDPDFRKKIPWLYPSWRKSYNLFPCETFL